MPHNVETYVVLLDKKKTTSVFTDPPYNVPIERHVCGNGKVKHREFAMASGEMSEIQFAEFLRRTLTLMRDFSADGSLHYICMDWRHIDTLMQVGKSVYSSQHDDQVDSVSQFLNWVLARRCGEMKVMELLGL